MKRKILLILVLLFASFSLFTLSSCGKEEADDSGSGNVTPLEPMDIDVSGVTLDSKVCAYTGQPYSLECPSLPEGVTVSYEGNGVSEVGTHSVVAILSDPNGFELKRLEAEITIVEITKEYLESIPFDTLETVYNGQPQSIEIIVPEGVTVTYKNNGKVNPGSYYVQAILEFDGIKVTKKAYINISRIDSDLKAEANQTVYLYGGDVYPKYELGNDEQTITYTIYKDGNVVKESALYTAGNYVVEITAKQSNLYKEAKVSVNLTVIDTAFDISFDDKTVEWDGNEHLVVAEWPGVLPDGYTVRYTDNAGTDVGSYYAIVEVLDPSENVVETHAATLTIVYPKNAAFEEYLDSFFYEYLEEDLLSINIFCENPSKWGFDVENYEASWYTYEASTPEDFEEAKVYFNELYADLTAFEEAQLSPLQQVAYNKVESFLLENMALYEVDDIQYMRIVYVDQFGGYVADFATYMEAYSYRSEKDVIDVIKFIESTEKAFPSYLELAKDKAAHGYALSKFTVTEMRNFLKDIIDQGKDYYLADAICAKINAVDSTILSDEQKASYCEQVVSAMDNEYLNGVQTLYDGLFDYINTLPAEEEGYWSTYENGKELFVADLESLLGLENFDVDAYIKELEDEFARTNLLSSNAQSAVVKRFGVSTNEQFYSVLSTYSILQGTPEEMMVYLKEFAPHIVPNLKSEPEINIKEMDEASAKASNAVAYYMKSALDNTGNENITLNPLKLGDANDVLSTLAHEGYPGHLYSYVYSKEIGQHDLSTIMTSTAHAEGWATYVALALYEYAMENTTDENLITVLQYLHANELNGYLINAMFDAYIHCRGWDAEDISNWLQMNYGYGKADGDEVGAEIYNLLIEMPVTYAAYAYGKLFFVKLHDEAREILGSFYNEVEFNAMLLSKGWTSLGELQNTYNEYMKAACHKHGLEFNQ